MPLVVNRRPRHRHVGSGLVNSISSLASTVVNRAVDSLPFELHAPGGYRYCGPGTRLQQRLSRGDKGINPLDEACKEHDIAYSRFTDNQRRKQADRLLANRAWTRVKAPDATIGERATAWAVTTAMNAKSKLGGGSSGRGRKTGLKRKKTIGKGYYLKPYRSSSGGGVVKKKKKDKKRKQERKISRVCKKKASR